MYEAEKVLSLVLPADVESTEVLQPGEETLNEPTASIASQPTTIWFLSSISSSRSHEADAAFTGERLPQRAAVVSPVADQRLGDFVEEAGLEGLVDKSSFMSLTTFNPNGDRKTMTVRDRHDLGSFPSAATSNARSPFFAPA